MPMSALAQLLRVAREHGDGGFSTSEQLFATLVFNRADQLAELGFTIAAALERLGPDCGAAEIPAAARTLRDE